MKHQRLEPKFLNRQVQHVGAVYTTTQSQDAVKLSLLAILLDQVNSLLKFFCAPLIGQPAWLNILIKVLGMITDSLLIKDNPAVGGVHHRF